MVNKNKLKSVIVKNGLTQAKVASAINISETAFSAKINNKRTFDIDEVKKICILLNISSPTELMNIFFT